MPKPYNDVECIGEEIPIQCPRCGEWYSADPDQKGKLCIICESNGMVNIAGRTAFDKLS